MKPGEMASENVAPISIATNPNQMSVNSKMFIKEKLQVRMIDDFECEICGIDIRRV